MPFPCRITHLAPPPTLQRLAQLLGAATGFIPRPDLENAALPPSPKSRRRQLLPRPPRACLPPPRSGHVESPFARDAEDVRTVVMISMAGEHRVEVVVRLTCPPRARSEGSLVHRLPKPRQPSPLGHLHAR